jgi:putative membrane protein
MGVIAMMHGGGGHMMGGMMGGWMLLWALLGLALLVLVVVATVWLVKQMTSSGSGSTHREILERRYAAGEIDREEFLQRREDLARRS